MGPVALFDKSFLQSLSLDEAVLFDHFFLSVIAPVFLAETLADLGKQSAGRSPEDEVRIISEKTPEISGGITTFHQNLALGNLMGMAVPMDGTVPVPHGKTFDAGAQSGVLIGKPPEVVALERWQKGEFQELERDFALGWREELKFRLEFDSILKDIARLGVDPARLRSLDDIASASRNLVQGGGSFRRTLELSMALTSVPHRLRQPILARWQRGGHKPLCLFAPYAAFVTSLDCFFVLAMARGFIAPERASNRVDLSYLYYLPFCLVFASSDGLHRRAAPLFMRPNQQFVWGPDLKADLTKVVTHFAALPADVRESGLFQMAPAPPPQSLVEAIWREHMSPGYLERLRRPRVALPPAKEKEIIAELNRKVDLGKVAPAAQPRPGGKADFMIVERRIRRRRGRWWQVPKNLPE